MNKKIIFYDGQCAVCNRLCAFLLERIDQHDFYFASIQDSQIYEEISHRVSPDIDSIVFMDGDNLHIYSDAVIELFSDMESYWRYISFFRVVPKILRDGIYRLFARYRYTVFGRVTECRLYSREQRKRILV